jgi:hypothetical protein
VKHEIDPIKPDRITKESLKRLRKFYGEQIEARISIFGPEIDIKTEKDENNNNNKEYTEKPDENKVAEISIKKDYIPTPLDF